MPVGGRKSAPACTGQYMVTVFFAHTSEDDLLDLQVQKTNI